MVWLQVNLLSEQSMKLNCAFHHYNLTLVAFDQPLRLGKFVGSCNLSKSHCAKMFSSTNDGWGGYK